MAEEFKVIETQEDLDKIIQKRLAQKDREIAETYKDYLSPEKVKDLKADYEKKLEDAKKLVEDANAKLADHDKVVNDLTKRAQDAETSLLKSNIAQEAGIPFKLADRLRGSNADEIKKDAEEFLESMKTTKTAPLRTGEVVGAHAPGTTKDAAMLGMLTQLNEQMLTN